MHEFVTTARPLRPLAPAVYVGVLLALFGAEKGGVVWLLGGFLATFVLALLAPRGLEHARADHRGRRLDGSRRGLDRARARLRSSLLREMHDHGRLIAFTVVLTAFAAATFAYFGGRLIGRHKLAPRLSPGKSWEGLLIGAVAGVFVSFIALYDTRHQYLSVWQAIVLGLVLVVAEVIGDLFESALKRDLDVKDTGTAARRARRHARPHRRAALRRAGGVFPRRRVRLSLVRRS